MIIGFGHRRRKGKDTSALLLQKVLENRGLSVEIRSFTTHLKWVSYVTYKYHGMKEPPYYDENPLAREMVLPAIGMTPRQVWILTGEAFRSIYRKTWIDPVISGIHVDVLLIPDVRHLNEVDAILDRGGEVYRVDRDKVPDVREAVDDDLQTFKNWNGIIPNHGTLDDLAGVIDTLAERILVRLERNRV